MSEAEDLARRWKFETGWTSLSYYNIQTRPRRKVFHSSWLAQKIRLAVCHNFTDRIFKKAKAGLEPAAASLLYQRVCRLKLRNFWSWLNQLHVLIVCMIWSEQWSGFAQRLRNYRQILIYGVMMLMGWPRHQLSRRRLGGWGLSVSLSAQSRFTEWLWSNSSVYKYFIENQGTFRSLLQ